MSESPSDFTESTAETPAVSRIKYIPTEEERKVFDECILESIWFRAVPLSATAMVVTHKLVVNGVYDALYTKFTIGGLVVLGISTGKLSANGRFGSLPKVLFAGVFSFIAGRLSYINICQQKFYNLKNMQQRQRHRQHSPQFSAPGSEFSEDEKSRFDVFQSESSPKEPYYPPDFSNSTHSRQPQELPPQVLRDEEHEVKRKTVMYEELRNKNRETYDITRSQKIDRGVPRMEGESLKKNKYGDTWDN